MADADAMQEQDGIYAQRWARFFEVLNSRAARRPDMTLTVVQMGHILHRLWKDDEGAKDLPFDDASYLGFDLTDIFNDPPGKQPHAWPIGEVIHRVTSVVTGLTSGPASVDIIGEIEAE